MSNIITMRGNKAERSCGCEILESGVETLCDICFLGMLDAVEQMEQEEETRKYGFPLVPPEDWEVDDTEAGEW